MPMQNSMMRISGRGGAWRSMVPLAGLFTILFVTWAYFLGRTGFYWDDWPPIWIYLERGLDGIDAFFGSDRPLYGYTYALLVPILGQDSERWFALLLAFVFATSVMWYGLLTDLWPQRPLRAWFAAAFLLVFPVFTHHGIAFTYVQHFVSSFLILLSLRASVAMVRSEGGRRAGWMVASVVSAALSYFLVEYYIGVELVRPWVLYVALRGRDAVPRSAGETGRTVLALWSPTLLVFVGFAAFQFFGQTSLGYRDADAQTAEIAARPVEALAQRGLTAFRNLVAGTVLTWVRPFEPRMIDFGFGRSVVASFAVLLVSMATVVLVPWLAGWPRRWSGPRGNADRDTLVLAVLLLLLCGLPIAFGDLYADLERSTRTRFAMPLMFGSTLLFARLVTSRARPTLVRMGVGALVIGASSAYQFRATNSLVADWEAQRELFWQMAWRLPDLEQGTSVFVEGLPEFMSANQAASHMNLLYGSKGEPGDLDYFIFALEGRGTKVTDVLVPLPLHGESTEGHLRSFRFDGTTSRSVAVWIPESGSVRILDGRRDGEVPYLGPLSKSVEHLSHPHEVLGSIDAIRQDPERMPAGPLLDWLGPEPVREWSYHFQKAELARQFDRWELVVEHEEAASKRGLEPEEASEWLPFVEARIHRRELPRAVELSRTLLEEDPYSFHALQRLWSRVALQHPDVRAEVFALDSWLAGHLGFVEPEQRAPITPSTTASDG